MKQLDTPVLFLTFNRLNTAMRVFEAIRRVRPLKLYIASDGPRHDWLGERDKVAEIRLKILQSVDWPCEVKTLFREKNLGCKYAVSSAIDWFFENEEMGIILEDDCLPVLSFFRFCSELLSKYQNDEQIFMVSGRNDMGKWKAYESSYFFTVGNIWGWASWRRAWKHYDVELGGWTDLEAQKSAEAHFYKVPWKLRDVRKGCIEVLNGAVNSWDYQWAYTRLAHRALGVVPSCNLVENIGFGSEATHTFFEDEYFAKVPAYDLSFPLKHPTFRGVDYEYYIEQEKRVKAHKLKRLPRRLLSKLKRTLYGAISGSI